jgi:hypothetical protein
MPSSSPPRTIADQQLGRFDVLFAAWFFNPAVKIARSVAGLLQTWSRTRMTVSGDLL